MNKNIVLLDYHNLMYRVLYVSEFDENNMGNEDFSYWKHLMINSIFHILREFSPDEIVVALDSKSPWRKKYLKEYKSNRKEKRDKSNIDFKKFYDVSNKFLYDMRNVITNFKYVYVDTAEADDVIAVLIKEKYSPRDNKVVISSDKDMHQLLKFDNVKIFNPIEKKFKSPINCEKELILKIITGDRSDNIPAIKERCGIKTAEKILNEGLEEFFEREEDGETYRFNYQRNKMLIDFDSIPHEVYNDILIEYENNKIKKINLNNFEKFLVDNKCLKLSKEISEHRELLRKLDGV